MAQPPRTEEGDRCGEFCFKYFNGDDDPCFATSEINQGEIRETCEKKFELLTVRTQVLEESVGAMKDELRIYKEEIKLPKGNE
ncbi:hypothetical protein NDU88_005074 [Pleurodeles waltl]|uniref:Uncharacterized protein n=1 Tax=Pleurodeles waltl TaxID=8319 RepID=A0AAV7WXH9_PLEWA|nr:hypothetical protein NDU88_005074 [Pleurodeles waltl]